MWVWRRRKLREWSVTTKFSSSDRSRARRLYRIESSTIHRSCLQMTGQLGLLWFILLTCHNLYERVHACMPWAYLGGFPGSNPSPNEFAQNQWTPNPYHPGLFFWLRPWCTQRVWLDILKTFFKLAFTLSNRSSRIQPMHCVLYVRCIWAKVYRVQNQILFCLWRKMPLQSCSVLCINCYWHPSWAVNDGIRCAVTCGH